MAIASSYFPWVLVLIVEISIQSLASYLSLHWVLPSTEYPYFNHLNPLPPAFKLSDCMALLLG